MPIAEPFAHELVEKQVRRQPGKVALLYEGQRISYAQLNGRANQLARWLRARGVGPERRVAICMDRGPESVAALLGVLKAGGACVLLDPGQPRERLDYVLHDARPVMVLTQERLQGLAGAPSATVAILEQISRELVLQPETDIPLSESGLSCRNLAYVIYTSGSTGVPKGVAAEHRGLTNRLLASDEIEGLLDDDVCCHKTTVAFIDTFFEVLGPLSKGLPLVIAPTATVANVEALAALVSRERITRLITVPALARSLLESRCEPSGWQQLRSWTLSGEEVTVDLWRRLQQWLPGCEFINLYGTSEVAADSTRHTSKGGCVERVAIGRPLRNTQAYVLDGLLEPVPIGVYGEIYLAGHGVARGYVGKPRLTADRFIPNPHGPPGSRMYRSGDLGRWRVDGTLEYQGRRDFQVKLRGFRIELAEIESRLLQFPGIHAAVVVARDDSAAGKHLVAYYVRDAAGDLANGDSTLSLRKHIGTTLPDYMVPAAFVRLETLPLSANGKVDRRALPRPGPDAFGSHERASPAGPVEARVAGIWAEVLGIPHVGRHDSFFDLGGHSLLAMHMISMVREALDVPIALTELFARPVLIDFAASLSQMMGEQALPDSHARG